MYLSNVYLSHHSKTVISAEEKVAELIQQRDTLERELAAERARLDWVFHNCKVTADGYATGNREVYAVHDREDLGAAMKEGAK